VEAEAAEDAAEVEEVEEVEERIHPPEVVFIRKKKLDVY
jgi:hypothetical protein